MTSYTATSIPPGWLYDPMLDGYTNGHGLRITRQDIAVHGNPTAAVVAIHGAKAIYGTAQMTRPSKTPKFGDTRKTATGEVEVYTQSGWINANPLGAVGSASNNLTAPGAVGATGPISHVGVASMSIGSGLQPNKITIKTGKGDVVMDLETGSMHIPPSIGRDEGIRGFWLGFFEHFQKGNNEKHEKEIKSLKAKMQEMKDEYTYAMKDVTKTSSATIVSKIKKKYGNEKFIMIKPDDLIAFIENN